MPLGTPTPAIVIAVADISEYLAIRDIGRKQVFQFGALNQYLPREIYWTNKALKWAYDQDPDYPGIVGVADFVYAMCGEYIPQALQILGLGNTGGVIVTPGGGQVMTIQKTIQFQVGNAATAPLLTAGQTSFIINDPDAAQGTVHGYIDHGRQLIGLPAEPLAFTPVWTPGKWTIGLNTPAITGLTYVFDYPISIKLTFNPNGDTGGDVYTAQTVNVETKDLLNQLGRIYQVPTNTYNTIDLAVEGIATDGTKCSFIWEGTATNSGGTITVLRSNSRFLENSAGVNTGTNVGIAVTADSVNGGINTAVLGVNLKTINWYGTYNRISSHPL